MAKIKAAVLFGGASKDHAASLQSAYSVLNNLSADKYIPVPIGITKSGRWLFYPGAYDAVPTGEWENDSDCCPAILSPDPIHSGILKILQDNEVSSERVDVVVSVLHGKYGECGRIQGLCKLAGIPFIGSRLDAANACTDKLLTHLILEKNGIKTVPYICVERASMQRLDEIIEEILGKFTFPLYVKAASCSSSIGANCVSNENDLKSALKIAFSHHHTALVEQTATGREIECGVYQKDNQLLTTVAGEILSVESITDKSIKYIAKTSKMQIPAELSPETEAEIRKIAANAFMALDCSGFAKVNFTVTANNNIYCNKVSNLPGLTEINIFPQLMKATGYSYPEMLDLLITQVLETQS